MRGRLAGRLGFALILLVFAFVGVDLLTGMAPGDAANEGIRSPVSHAAKRERLGLDRPLGSRLGTRVRRLAVLDLGTSISYDQPVLTLVVQRATTTLQAGGA